MPLLPCDKEEILSLWSDDNDELLYKLHLMAKPAPQEKTIFVTANLGGYVDFTLKIKNYNKNSSDFNAEVKNHNDLIIFQYYKGPFLS